MPVDYKPAGYHTVTPYLIVDGAQALIDFTKQVLDASERLVLPGKDGRIGHAELQVGDSVIMLADAGEQSPVQTAMLHLYVEDTDATYRRALAAGAQSLREPTDEFYGDRMSGVKDSLGNTWYFATHVRDVSDEDMQKAAAELAEAPAR